MNSKANVLLISCILVGETCDFFFRQVCRYIFPVISSVSLTFASRAYFECALYRLQLEICIWISV